MSANWEAWKRKAAREWNGANERDNDQRAAAVTLPANPSPGSHSARGGPPTKAGKRA